jgi:hypothetical protein
MQVQLQAFSRKTESLRKAITDDLENYSHEVLFVKEKLNPERKSGWSKVQGKNLPGALNIEWDASSHMLLVRAVTRGGNTPHQLLGVFLDYLLERHGERISNINIQLRINK